jgi:GYF domain 2
MDYTVKRGDQTFGPYTLSELQQYIQSGRLLPGDLAQSEGMSDWFTLSQILGNIPLPAAAKPGFEVPAQPLVELPPNLHWGLLLALFIVSRLFGFIFVLFIWAWSMVLANWARKLSNNNKPLVLVAMYPAGFVAGVLAMGFASTTHNVGLTALGGIFVLAGAIIYLYGIFKIKDAMEEYYNSRENIALTLSGVMTFFFSIVYLQYHVNRIARWKKTGVLS